MLTIKGVWILIFETELNNDGTKLSASQIAFQSAFQPYMNLYKWQKYQLIYSDSLNLAEYCILYFVIFVYLYHMLDVFDTHVKYLPHWRSVWDQMLRKLLTLR